MQLLSEALTLDRRTGLDWMTLPRLFPLKGGGVLLLGVQSRKEQTKYYCKFIFDVLAYSI